MKVNMAQEHFLINPPKRLGHRRKRKKNPIGETLVTIGANPMRRNPENPWMGDPEGHRIAALMRWGKVKRGRVARHRHRSKRVGGRSVAKRRVVRRSVRRVSLAIPRRRRSIDMRSKAYRAERLRQQREAASYLGMFTGPGKKRKYAYRRGKGYVRIRKNPFGGYTMARRKRASRKRNSWFGAPVRHRKAAKKGWRRGHLLKKGKVRRRVRHRNPGTAISNSIRYRRRSVRRRRNPMLGGTIGQFTSGMMNVREWGPLAVTGAVSAISGAIVPQMFGVVNPWAKLGAQTALAIGGGLVVEKFVDKRHGQAWMVVGVAMVGYQLLKQFVLMPYLPQFAVGLGGYQDYYPNSSYEESDEVSQQVGAFPAQVGAFVNDYPGVGGEDMGAYPYDGAAY